MRVRRRLILVFLAFLVVGVLIIYLPRVLYRKTIERRLESAGGIEKINQQAILVFDRLDKQGYPRIPLLEHELTNIPAILALGRTVVAFHGAHPHIRVQIGTHYRGGILRIYDPRKRHSFEEQSGELIFSNNIVFSYW